MPKARVRFVESNAAGVDQQQHRATVLCPFGERPAQGADDLGAVHFAHRTAHVAAFLGGDQHRLSSENAAADDHAIVERAGHAKHGQVRAGRAVARAQDLREAAGIQ